MEARGRGEAPEWRGGGDRPTSALRAGDQRATKEGLSPGLEQVGWVGGAAAHQGLWGRFLWGGCRGADGEAGAREQGGGN